MPREVKEASFLTNSKKVREDALILSKKTKRKVLFMSEKLKKGQIAALETDIRKFSIKLIDGFSNHPFYVFDDDEMSDLTESIRKNGLISPVIVRQKADRFELISGHRRKHACDLLGHDKIACRIVEASGDEAIIMMVDSNCQRTKCFRANAPLPIR